MTVISDRHLTPSFPIYYNKLRLDEVDKNLNESFLGPPVLDPESGEKVYLATKPGFRRVPRGIIPATKSSGKDAHLWFVSVSEQYCVTLFDGSYWAPITGETGGYSTEVIKWSAVASCERYEHIQAIDGWFDVTPENLRNENQVNDKINAACAEQKALVDEVGGVGVAPQWYKAMGCGCGIEVGVAKENTSNGSNDPCAPGSTTFSTNGKGDSDCIHYYKGVFVIAKDAATADAMAAIAGVDAGAALGKRGPEGYFVTTCRKTAGYDALKYDHKPSFCEVMDDSGCCPDCVPKLCEMCNL
ncbi:hypothetical protein CMI47_19925 [Candidatus Pacearchaeota archaeon]|nr:hypothetical protein [Candidatus Pacearchaeota archaeon]